MLIKLFPLIRKQNGFTLVELLVAVAITAVIGSALTMTISQLFSVSISDTNRMEAVKQVENALHYINRDVQMAFASEITPKDGSSVLITPTSGIHLHWIDYTVSPIQDNQVIYILNANYENYDLKRTQIINGNSTTTVVASHIYFDALNPSNPLNPNYKFDGSVLTINLTASVQGYKSATETRNLQVKPRVD